MGSYSLVIVLCCSVVFTVGDQPAKNFRMIERHYFKNSLMKSFDFNFPFCIPNSTNSSEHIYDLPQLSDAISKYHVRLSVLLFVMIILIHLLLLTNLH